MKVGQKVIYSAPEDRDALVTAVLGEGPTPALNLVIVNDGGTVEIKTSVAHHSQVEHGPTQVEPRPMPQGLNEAQVKQWKRDESTRLAEPSATWAKEGRQPNPHWRA